MSSYKEHICPLDWVGRTIMCGRRLKIPDPGANAGSSRMFSDVPICLSLISHVSLAASRPFKWNKDTQKDTSSCIHMQRSLCLVFSPSCPSPSERKSLEEQAFFREAWAPTSSSYLGCNQHNGGGRWGGNRACDCERWDAGVQITVTCALAAPQSSTLAVDRKRLCSHTPKKPVIP